MEKPNIRAILQEGELVVRAARITLERTFNFDTAKIKTFEDNFNTVLAGEIYTLIEKHRAEYDEHGNGRMHKEKFETL